MPGGTAGDGDVVTDGVVESKLPSLLWTVTPAIGRVALKWIDHMK
jgi:hypothetical protein